ncbi:MAG: hypothetical protein D6790_19030 [Caldilineae bacterium]|nr:MAG: hypothetical protein D6790_19030 [Caldilineae bacterium]
MTTPAPLSLPETFDPAANMPAYHTDTGVYHQSRQAARLAADLVVNGAPEDLDLAVKVLDATLACQERNPADPHYGNFYWMAEDTVVEDLNAVEFVLESLIPMMLRHRERLPEAMQARVLEAIHLGLDEIRRLDVLVAYTNITALDILNTCLGGELLQDPDLMERGQTKLLLWIGFTLGDGHPMEYNSPTYTGVTLRALALLAELTQREEVRGPAQAFAARLALSAALHIHPGTGRWAGPHSRAYHPSIVGETPPEIERMRAWVARGVVPPWIEDVLAHRPARYTITETASRRFSLAFSTYVTPGYALGVASAGFGPQADVCMAHFVRPPTARPGVLYTRYVTNDKWFGDFYHATDRGFQRNLLDEGRFYGVQNRNRALGVYAPQSFSQGTSAKAAFIWNDMQGIDQVWIDDQRIQRFPATVPLGATVSVASGDAWTAVRVLHITPLGRETPIQLVQRGADLVLEAYNYRGKEKRFWEMNWPGAFWKGHPICAFYLEVADRTQYPDGASFAAAINAGQFNQEVEPPFTYPAEGQRRAQFSYSRDGRELGLALDLMEWRLLERWTESGPLGWPMLEAQAETAEDASLFAVQTSEGRAAAAGAVAACDAPGLWLWGDHAAGVWAAGHFAYGPTTLHVETPEGAVTVEHSGPGVFTHRDRTAGEPSPQK